MDEISEDELNLKLGIKDAISAIADKEINSIVFSKENYHAHYSSFTRCKFNGKVNFIYLDLGYGLKIVESEFMNEVNLTQVAVNEFSPLLNIYSESITFIDCVFRKHFEIHGGSKIQRALVFKNCRFERGITIRDLEIEIDGLEFTSCNIEGKFELSRIKMGTDLNFSGNTISADTNINELTCRAVWYHRGNIVTGSILKNACKIVEDITYNASRFSEPISLRDNEIEKGGLKIFESVFDKAFNLSYRSGHLVNRTELKACTISGSVFSGGFELEGAEPGQQKPKISIVEIITSNVMKGSITFTGLNIGYLLLSGHNTSAALRFRDISVNQLNIEGLINDGGLIFSGLSACDKDWPELSQVGLIGSKLKIIESNLGKMQIFQSDLRPFKKVDVNNIILSDISTSMVKWFSHQQLEDGKVDPLVDTLKNSKGDIELIVLKAARAELLEVLQSKREFYRQLKHAALKQGDMSQAPKFQHREMKYYYQINKYERPRDYSEYLILWSSQSNDFGQSWLRALKLLLIFSFVTYLPIGFLTSAEIDYDKWANDPVDILMNLKVIFWDNLKTWIVLLNPTHRMSDISENIKEYPSIIYFFDLLSRIVVSYFIFQMVTAFRKFSK